MCCREILKIPDGISKSQCSLDEMVSKVPGRQAKKRPKGVRRIIQAPNHSLKKALRNVC